MGKQWAADDPRRELLRNRHKGSDPVTPTIPFSVQKDVTMPKEKDLHYARWVTPGIGVLSYLGQEYDRGELLTLGDTPKNEQLMRLGYIDVVDLPRQIAACGVCAKKFKDEYHLNLHGSRRHKDRFRNDIEVVATRISPTGEGIFRDVTGDAEEKRLMQEVPLYLDKTKASL